MAAVALTKDGNLDLVVPTNLLNVFHGDGKGGFTPTGAYAVTTQVGLGAAYLFADANGDGNQDLIVAGLSSAVLIFPGNGDGTLQAPPGASVSGPVADVNNDGIADMVFLPAQGGNYFGTALGRGDGSFAILNQTTPLPAAQTGYVLMTGDFNGDGKTDAIAIQPGSVGHNALTCVAPDAQLLSFLGSGDGRFQAKGTALALGVSGAGAGATGDFNSDGNLDIILPYNCQSDGTLIFAWAWGWDVWHPRRPQCFHGKKPISTFLSAILIMIRNWTSYGTAWSFWETVTEHSSRLPLTIPTGDHGGRHCRPQRRWHPGCGLRHRIGPPSGGSTIYAGNGDGTFAATGFYTVPWHLTRMSTLSPLEM